MYVFPSHMSRSASMTSMGDGIWCGSIAARSPARRDACQCRCASLRVSALTFVGNAGRVWRLWDVLCGIVGVHAGVCASVRASRMNAAAGGRDDGRPEMDVCLATASEPNKRSGDPIYLYLSQPPSKSPFSTFVIFISRKTNDTKHINTRLPASDTILIGR